MIKNIKLILYIMALLSTKIFGLTVYDPANHQVNMLTKIEAVKQTLEQVQHNKNLLEQIKNDTINMASLGRELTTGQLDMLQKNIQSIINIRNQSLSEINNYKNFQQNFKSLYKDFKDFDNYTFDQQLEYSNRLLGEAKNSITDAYRVLEIGDVSKISNDSQRIRTIMSAANSAEGQKAVLQATSQFAGMQIEILGEQRTLMAEGLKAQNAVMLKQIQEEAIENSNIQSMRGISPELKGNQRPANILNRKW
ncbi:conjugal transfer protein TrbJ [Cetobacterium sp.]|uniref:conjugal transfer protein TrbJ n=1 Tax=Cetobacterium sp. TaxID=2071632 RepID=UPI002FC9EC2A